MVRGDFAIFAGKAGEEIGKKITNSLERICDARYKILKNKKLKDRLSSVERRELYFIEDAKYEGWLNLGEREIVVYGDGEIKVRLPSHQNVRGRDVFLVQNWFDPSNPQNTNSNIMETFIFSETLKRAKASHVTLVLPYLSYAKQDKQKGKEPITPALLAAMFPVAGIDGLITMDLHSDQIVGFFRANEVRVENIFASPLLIDYFRTEMSEMLSNTKYLTMCSPDAGGAARAKHYAKILHTGWAIGSKNRRYDEAHVVDSINLLGNVEGCNVVVIDDQIASGGSMEEITKELKRRGAKDIYLACTHPLLIGKAKSRFDKLYPGYFKQLVTTDTITHDKDFIEKTPWLKQISVADFLALAIYETHVEGSVSKLYEEEIRKDLFL